MYALVSAELGLKNPITGIAACCARAAGGQTAAPLSAVMKSRRRIAFSKTEDRVIFTCNTADQIRKLRPAEWGPWISP
jgi:hypothetical protein